MADASYKKVEIGFVAGGAILVRLTEADHEELRSALASVGTDGGARWHELKAEDTDVTLDLSKVTYLRIDTERGRVGF